MAPRIISIGLLLCALVCFVVLIVNHESPRSGVKFLTERNPMVVLEKISIRDFAVNENTHTPVHDVFEGAREKRGFVKDWDSQWRIGGHDGACCHRVIVFIGNIWAFFTRDVFYENPAPHTVSRRTSGIFKGSIHMQRFVRLDDEIKSVEFYPSSMLQSNQLLLLFPTILHHFELAFHHDSLSPDDKEHAQIDDSNDKRSNDVSLKPPLRGLWNQLDFLSNTVRVCLILIGIVPGSFLLYWGVSGDRLKRLAAGLSSGLFLSVFGWNVLVDFVLRVSG
jgi:hypothetical protein